MRDRLIALLIMAAATVAAVRWTAAHPLPLWFDEANYANQAFEDRAAVLRGGPVAGVKALLFNDPVRPPAYRALVLPFTLIAPRLPVMRGVALTATLLAFALLALASRSWLASAIVLAMPAVFSSGAWFGTEYPLFVAVALLMFALVPRVRPVPLAIAVALGLLAKSSVLPIVAPVLLVAWWFGDRLRIFLASAAGTLIAFGWWGWHLVAALRYAQGARTYARASVTGTLAENAVLKARLLVVDATGPLVFSVMVVLLVVLAIRRDTADRRTVAIALAGSLPLLMIVAVSSTFGPRIFSPALVPLALLLGLALDRVSPAARVIAGALVLAQTIFIAPVLPRVPQTDWRILRAHVQTSHPRIAVLGGWPSLTPPEIRYAWTRDGADAEVETLWRFEFGPIDWPKVMQHALASDLVLVVPPGRQMPKDSASSGAFPIDNRYNAEFIARLERTGAFERVAIGDATLLAYRRTSSKVPSGGSPSVAR